VKSPWYIAGLLLSSAPRLTRRYGAHGHEEHGKVACAFDGGGCRNCVPDCSHCHEDGDVD
jgi:hypothetical protein